MQECCSYNFASGSFHTKKLCSRLISIEVEFTGKTAKSCFVPPFGGLRAGVKYIRFIARWKTRGRLPISATALGFYKYKSPVALLSYSAVDNSWHTQAH